MVRPVVQVHKNKSSVRQEYMDWLDSQIIGSITIWPSHGLQVSECNVRDGKRSVKIINQTGLLAY